MGKKQKFTEDLLLEAVVKYAEVCFGKVKATELAEWARVNITGLEDVRDYHFTRSVRIRDLKTGEIKERTKQCTERINEINKARSISNRIKTNVLLKSTNIEAVFELPKSIQKQLIIETRNTVNKLINQADELRRENAVLKDINKGNYEQLNEIVNSINKIKKNQALLEKKVKYLMKITDEAFRKDKLLEIGIKDGYFDLVAFLESLENSINDLTDFEEAIASYHDDSYTCLNIIEKKADTEAIKNDIIKSLFHDI